MDVSPRSVTFELTGDTYAILVNALFDAARLLDHQAEEQERWNHLEYATNLRGTAAEARVLLARVEEAGGDA